MKLTATMLERTLSQYDAQAIPESHPAVAQLNSLFGDHTFFLDGDGLNIVEPVERAPKGELRAQVVRLADWKDAERTSLVPQEPEATDIVVVLGIDGRDD